MATDAEFLLVSIGGPEGPDDVMPFLRNVTAGRDVPEDRLAEVAEHYYLFGGVSPINAQCRDLVRAIEKDFAASGIGLPVYWGNRNWRPYLAETMQAMADDGVRTAIAFATSAYSSFSSCRQYLDDIARARALVGEKAAQVTKIPPYYRHEAFIASFADAAAQAVESLPEELRAGAELVFTAHSIPESMAAASGPRAGPGLADGAGRDTRHGSPFRGDDLLAGLGLRREAWRPGGHPSRVGCGHVLRPVLLPRLRPGRSVTGGEPARDAPAAADPHRLLGLAIAVAREAGEMLADQYGRPAVVGTKSSPTDVVTEMDQAAERLIRSRILAERPDDAILGEEGGQIGGEAPVRWIVDPLDGTVNYLYGLPDWAVSIAAEAGGRRVAPR